MKKIEKLLRKHYYRDILKINSTKLFVNQSISMFKRFDIQLKVKTIEDYFKVSIMMKSFTQKRAIEEAYEANRAEFFEVWEKLDYKQKNKFTNEALERVRQQSSNFTFNDKVIRICFFDEVLNALYDHEMAVFELEQFFSLATSFKQRLQPVEYYGLEPYCQGFVKEEFLMRHQQKVVVYDESVAQVYIINEDFKVGVLSFNCIVKDELNDLMIAYLNQDSARFLSCLIEGTMIKDNLRKKLIKIQKKGHYETV